MGHVKSEVFGRTKPDAWLVLLIFSAILGVDWFLRKKWGLV